MPQIFKCAACSAPLEFEGTMMQKCGFCGGTVVVPPEMFYAAEARGKAANGEDPRLAAVRAELERGNKIGAIKLYFETFKTDLRTAKDAVDAMDPQFAGGRRRRRSGFGISVAVLSALVVAVAGIVFAFLMVPAPATLMAEESSGRVAASGAQPETVELMRIGGKGTGAGRFEDNREVAVDGTGNIYSADYSGGRMQRFDAEGNFSGQWLLEDGSLVFSIAANRAGTLYVLTNRGIRAYEGATGKLLAKVDERRLRGLAVTLEGNVVAVGRQGIVIYDGELKQTREFEDAAEAANSSFGFEKVAVDGKGTMFMLGRPRDEVIVFSGAGKFLNRIKTEVRSPNDIALDAEGRIYLSDTNSIHVLDPDGRMLKVVKATQAFGMAINDSGEMFVASRPYVVKQRIGF